VGIGGSGMCGIAEVLLNMGYSISGSDIKESKSVEHLRKLGAEIYIGHGEENLNHPHVVVVSSAVSKDNPEVKHARKQGIPIIPRAEMLAELMRLKYSVCVAGTHGKTTTTSMVGLIFSHADIDPTLVIGGQFKNLESNAKLGGGEFIVAEADESDGSFLHFTPSIGIVTNIDNDHMDYYKNLESLTDTFVEFLNKVPFYGFSILCGDDQNLRNILPRLTRPYKTYGQNKDNDYVAEDIKLNPEKSVYRVRMNGRGLGKITVNSSGRHNILNSLAACAAALEIGVDFSTIQKALEQYKGVGRRLEKVGEFNQVVFYDDYAHHPTEIALSLKSIKEMYPERRLIVIFQPHRYTRTRDLFKEFPGGLEVADFVYMTDIYSAGEKSIPGVSSDMISEKFTDKSKVKIIREESSLIEEIKNKLLPGDICITLGAGDVNKINKSLMSGEE
jgi:UDP-N-acetylmuramate--alanine ligase